MQSWYLGDENQISFCVPEGASELEVTKIDEIFSLCCFFFNCLWTWAHLAVCTKIERI